MNALHLTAGTSRVDGMNIIHFYGSLPTQRETCTWLSQSAVPVAPNTFLLAYTPQKQSTYPAKDVIPSIIPENHWLSSQTQFQ